MHNRLRNKKRDNFRVHSPLTYSCAICRAEGPFYTYTAAVQILTRERPQLALSRLSDLVKLCIYKM
jgi:hypothetical protein